VWSFFQETLGFCQGLRGYPGIKFSGFHIHQKLKTLNPPANHQASINQWSTPQTFLETITAQQLIQFHSINIKFMHHLNPVPATAKQ
jgi:hypothetical protein